MAEGPPDSDTNPPLNRRDLLRILGGVAAANGLGALGWAGLEAFLPKRAAAEWHKAVCRFCGTGCGIQVGMRDGRVVDVRGDELAHNRGVLCIKGSMNRALPYLEGRLTTPKIRENGTLRTATWEEAYTLVASKFREAMAEGGPEAVAFYGSGQLYTEESYTASKLFKAGLRSNNVEANARLCMASAAAGYVQVYGKDEPPGTYEDIDHAEFFFLIGANPFECHPPLFERIQRRRRLHPGVEVICIDPRRTQTADHSTLHLAPVPGTDLLLLLAMAQVICAEGWIDRPFIDEHLHFKDGETSVTFADFEAFLAKYTPEAVATELGIGAADIRQIAFKFARSKATMSLWTMGINQRTQGTALNAMLNTLHLITGQIGRPGATPFSLTGQTNACGGCRDTGAFSDKLPNGRVIKNEAHRNEMEDLWGVPRGTIAAKPGHDARALFRAMEDGSVKACLLMCSNPAQSMPAAGRYREAMSKCFLAVAEIFEDSETAQVADVLFPAALWVEKEGIVGQGERRYQHVPKLLEPQGECRSDLRILTELADHLGLGKVLPARTPEEVWNEYRKVSSTTAYNFSGMTYERLRAERGIQWPCPDEKHPGTARRYVPGDPFVAPGRRFHFYGQHDGRAVVTLHRYVPSPEAPTADYPLILTTGRVLEQWHTGTMTERIAELRTASGPARLDIHGADAAKLAIADGDRVRLTSRYGAVDGTARITDRLRPGVVFAAFYDVKLLVNRVVADNIDPTSRQPEYKITAINLRRLEA